MCVEIRSKLIELVGSLREEMGGKTTFSKGVFSKGFRLEWLKMSVKNVNAG